MAYEACKGIYAHSNKREERMKKASTVSAAYALSGVVADTFARVSGEFGFESPARLPFLSVWPSNYSTFPQFQR